MRDVDLTKIHYLSGPIAVETAEPGDALLVEILDVQPFPQVGRSPRALVSRSIHNANRIFTIDAMGIYWSI